MHPRREVEGRQQVAAGSGKDAQGLRLDAPLSGPNPRPRDQQPFREAKPRGVGDKDELGCALLGDGHASLHGARGEVQLGDTSAAPEDEDPPSRLIHLHPDERSDPGIHREDVRQVREGEPPQPAVGRGDERRASIPKHLHPSKVPGSAAFDGELPAREHLPGLEVEERDEALHGPGQQHLSLRRPERVRIPGAPRGDPQHQVQRGLLQGSDDA